jgi:hypothetical protein
MLKITIKVDDEHINRWFTKEGKPREDVIEGITQCMGFLLADKDSDDFNFSDNVDLYDLGLTISGRREDEVNSESDETVFCDICLDFDGVIHSYTSGWGDGAHVVADAPVEGAISAIWGYIASGLSVAIYSARSAQPGGIEAMKAWLATAEEEWKAPEPGSVMPKRVVYSDKSLVEHIQFPIHKPAAKVYYDDRGVRFDGNFLSPDELRALFTPWNK